ncbi:MAG: sensor histidine kinase [Bryobacteraceae bacterium]|nr:sensor histidine kinase [Bryobacteraceae bacterium]
MFLRNTAPFPRRYPWQAWLLLAQFGVSIPFAGLTIVSAATIPLVIERRRWRIWLPAFLLASVIYMVGSTVLTAKFRQLPASVSRVELFTAIGAGALELLAWNVFAFVAAFLIVHFDEDRRRLAQVNAELKGSQILLLESGRLAERLRISRELHDSLGHHLTSLSLQLEVAGHLPDEQLRPQLQQARFIAKLVLADIREAVSEWREETSTALPDALQALTSAVAGTQLVLDVATEIPATSPTITHALFRCTQEAVTNAIKHGAAKRIKVTLRHASGALHLAVQDDGVGAAEVRPGNGLTGMRSRVEEIGGTLRITTGPGAGFQLEIQVPLGEIA